jgi:hypothetical protein
MRISSPICALLLCVGCGGGSGGVGAPSPASRFVTFTAFLDGNRDGAIDASERIRIPGAEILFGDASGKSAPLTGEVSLKVPQTALRLSVGASRNSAPV